MSMEFTNETMKTAKEQYDEFMEGEVEPDPLERLRFFCSLAMDNRDWLDVEPFFNDVNKANEERRAHNALLIGAVRNLTDICITQIGTDYSDVIHAAYLRGMEALLTPEPAVHKLRLRFTKTSEKDEKC